MAREHILRSFGSLKYVGFSLWLRIGWFWWMFCGHLKIILPLLVPSVINKYQLGRTGWWARHRSNGLGTYLCFLPASSHPGLSLKGGGDSPSRTNKIPAQTDEFKPLVPSLGWFCPPGDTWWCLGACLSRLGGRMLPAPGGWRPGMLLHTPQGTRCPASESPSLRCQLGWALQPWLSVRDFIYHLSICVSI